MEQAIEEKIFVHHNIAQISQNGKPIKKDSRENRTKYWGINTKSN